MKKTLRKISAFFLLLTSCMPFLFTVFFLMKQQVIRHEMKEKLEKEFLHTVSVPKDKVIWVKYKKEIRIENKMFDVESAYEKDGLCYFIGLFDTEETELNEMLEKETEEKNENDSSKLFQWLQSPGTHLTFYNTNALKPGRSYSTPILLHISTPFINTPTQPPQV